MKVIRLNHYVTFEEAYHWLRSGKGNVYLHKDGGVIRVGRNTIDKYLGIDGNWQLVTNEMDSYVFDISI